MHGEAIPVDGILVLRIQLRISSHLWKNREPGNKNKILQRNIYERKIFPGTPLRDIDGLPETFYERTIEDYRSISRQFFYHLMPFSVVQHRFRQLLNREAGIVKVLSLIISTVGALYALIIQKRENVIKLL
jgi:hypothetical protein